MATEDNAQTGSHASSIGRFDVDSNNAQTGTEAPRAPAASGGNTVAIVIAAVVVIVVLGYFSGAGGALAATFTPATTTTTTTTVTTTTTTTATTTTTTTTATTSTTTTTGEPVWHAIRVLSYNLYWWCTSGVKNDWGGQCPQYANGEGFRQLYNVMNKYGPYELIGLQESDDADHFLGDFFKQTPAGWKTEFWMHQGPEDLGMAYDTSVFTPLTEYKAEVIGSDIYGLRQMGYIRLKFIGSDATVFFANTHGPLFRCGDPHVDDATKAIGVAVAKNFSRVVTENAVPGDALIFTGDFNCNEQTTEMEFLHNIWSMAARGSGGISMFDHIFIDDKGQYPGKDFPDKGIRVTTELTEGSKRGRPSDHDILWANIEVRGTPGAGKAMVSYV